MYLKAKIYRLVKIFLQRSFFLFINILLKLQQLVLICFCKFSCNSVIVMSRATKINKVKNFLPFIKFMKRPQTKFHAHTMRVSQVIRSKTVKIYRQAKFSCSTVFSFYRYFIATATTHSGMLLQVQLQFCNNNGFVAISEVTMLLCPLPDH